MGQPIGTALIFDSRLSARHQPKLQDRGAGVSHSVFVYFPAFAGTNLNCLVTEAHGCEQLAQSCNLMATWPGIKLTTVRSRVRCHTVTPPSHPYIYCIL